MQLIPIQDSYNQQFQTQLQGQNCTIRIYQLSTGLFADLYVNNQRIIGGVICQDRNRIVRDKYLGFIGDLCFMDLQGREDPISPGLGSRFVLIYLDPFDL